MLPKQLVILGTRGIPNRYGGFETFAEKLAPYLVQQGWQITVYCQQDMISSPAPLMDEWQGVKRVHLTPTLFGRVITGAYGTILFDLMATWHAWRHKRRAVWLTLGYNTSLFNVLPKCFGTKQIINMDGMEWQRDKWSGLRKAYLYLAYHIAGRVADHLVADHPEIEAILKKSFKTPTQMIAYGSPVVQGTEGALVQAYGVEPGQYALIIARAVPENGILEIVQSWSKQGSGQKLLIIGAYDPQDAYQGKVLSYRSENIVFAGAIYDRSVLDALREHCLFYFHGYRVGGTNPSLIEAMGCGAAIIAHDNRFNRWVVGQGGLFYADQAALDRLITGISAIALPELRHNARQRHQAAFQWQPVLEAYEGLIKSCC